MQLTVGKNPEQLVRMLDAELKKQTERWRPFVYAEPVNESSVEISGEHRDNIVRWLAQLNKKFYFAAETFFLSVTVLDRFLNIVKCRPKHLRIIGLACLYVAAKTREEDEVLPTTLELVQRSEVGCSVAELHRMELIVLSKLSFDLNATTTLEILHILYALLLTQQPRLLDHVPQVTVSRQLAMLTEKLMICAIDHHLLSLPPAALAVAILSLELELFSSEWLPATFWLQHHAQVDQKGLVTSRETVSTVLSGRCDALAFVYQCKRSHRPTKRRISALDESDDEEQENGDMYIGIKRLYAEEPCEPALIPVIN